MTCAEARPLLAAYRRDDTTAEESAALVTHLAACEACQTVEASFRRAGTLVRHLRTEVPPPSFRAAVFAAIAEEQRRLTKYETPAARLARAETDPGLPVVRALPASLAGRQFPRAATRRGVPRVSGPAVAAMAAVLLLGVFTAHALPGGGFAALGAALGGVFGHHPPPPRSATPRTRVPADGERAGHQWLARL